MKLSSTLLFALLLVPCASFGANRSSYQWDKAKPVDADTLLFGESPKKEDDVGAIHESPPDPSERGYPWYCLEKGNERYLNREYDKATIFFKAAYAVPGPTRVISGFRLIDAYQKLDWVDPALEVLSEMEKKYLVSPREFREATRLRMDLEDRKRKGAAPKKMSPLTGREWLLHLEDWRLHYVLGAMDKLRQYGIPLQEEAQGYVFLLDEFFTAQPETPADDAPKVLADLVYERDIEARIPIDRWRMYREGALTEEAKAAMGRPKDFTGAEWVTMVHDDKLDYVTGAIKLLKDQNVPMEKEVYAYTDALDALFTEKPELSASDSVRALASVLYETEPEARKVLEALRLE